jgi:hypothetical protein
MIELSFSMVRSEKRMNENIRMARMYLHLRMEKTFLKTVKINKT